MGRAFIGIGSNEGDRLYHISASLRALGASDGIRLLQMATILETDPVGGPPQASYLNTVIEVEADLEPLPLLRTLQAVERRFGRIRCGQRWAPRTIDLDLLLYDERIIQAPDLTIPHPRLHERLFVLEPLAQIAPSALHPAVGRTIAELLAQSLAARGDRLLPPEPSGDHAAARDETVSLR